jgi:KTSC domain-containing protein
MPEMLPVKSRTIDALGYDVKSHELYVHFSEADVTYVYEGVEHEKYQALMEADSKGQYLNEVIKSRYLYRRL